MMPWESQQPGPPRPAPPPPGPVAPPAPQQMQYDVEQAPGYTYAHAPVPAYQPPQNLPPAAPAAPPGIDLGALIKEAVNTAVQQNKQQFVQNTQKAIEKAVDKKTDALEEQVEHLEESFSGGVVTTRTFVQGAAIDIGFAALAAGAMVIGPDADLFSTELWTLVGAMMFKTMIQTGMSYMMRMQVR